MESQVDNLIEFVYPVAFLVNGGKFETLPWEVEEEEPPSQEEKDLEAYIGDGGEFQTLPWEVEEVNVYIVPVDEENFPPIRSRWEEKELEMYIEDGLRAQDEWNSFPEPTPVIDEWEGLSEDEELEALRGLGLLPTKIFQVQTAWEKIEAWTDSHECLCHDQDEWLRRGFEVCEARESHFEESVKALIGAGAIVATVATTILNILGALPINLSYMFM